MSNFGFCMQVFYGNYVTDSLDQASLNGMIEYWLSPNAVKKDFELARGKQINKVD